LRPKKMQTTPPTRIGGRKQREKKPSDHISAYMNEKKTIRSKGEKEAAPDQPAEHREQKRRPYIGTTREKAYIGAQKVVVKCSKQRKTRGYSNSRGRKGKDGE